MLLMTKNWHVKAVRYGAKQAKDREREIWSTRN